MQNVYLVHPQIRGPIRRKICRIWQGFFMDVGFTGRKGEVASSKKGASITRLFCVEHVGVFWSLKPSVHLSKIGHREWITRFKSEKVFTLIALYYRKKKTEIKESRFLIELLYCYNVYLKTYLVILKTVFLFCDNYIAMTYFTQVYSGLRVNKFDHHNHHYHNDK